MSIQIIINGENAEHALIELSAFSAGLTGGQAVASVAQEAPKAPRTRSTPKPETVKADEPVQNKPDSEPEASQEEEQHQSDPEPSDDEAPIPTDVDLRAAAQAKGAEGADKKALIKPLLTKFGVSNVTAVPADQRVAFLAELQAL
ncbi:hypothetical protein [Cohnella luojiensis]|uniref:Uncharacterized protein n=1 Tax=Cohnella luojiensis TaxID=652876 RepID=A0A4Y8M585_9BACL|nr:hypothetical protein [Cohnella luojiensis]TFE30810.1 hypothetical protein E2980_03260 [Cohnella luojiensis]